MIQPQPADDRSLDVLITWIDSAEALMQFGGPTFTFPLTRAQLTNSLVDNSRFAFQYIDTDTMQMVAYDTP